MQQYTIQEKKLQAAEWYALLRDRICDDFVTIERNYNPRSGVGFRRTNWDREGGGGGQISVMQGCVFEKVGVNISTVYGEFSENFAKEIPGVDGDRSFWAGGISVVAHLCSPKVPAVHMNTRFICTSNKSWFGGGMDLTPMYYDHQDCFYFHKNIREICDKFDAEYYPKFKQNADEYFYLKNRAEPRGIGGIFYDYLNTGSWDEDFAYNKAVGEGFAEIYTNIVRRSMYMEWTPEQRQYQLLKRGRYAEFNLLYDRGVRFGLMTNGRMDAIMMSMPPALAW